MAGVGAAAIVADCMAVDMARLTTRRCKGFGTKHGQVRVRKESQSGGGKPQRH